MASAGGANALRMNLRIERDDDPLVYEILATVRKGQRRQEKLKRMLHLAALVERGLLPRTALPDDQSGQRKGSAFPADANIGHSDIDVFFTPPGDE